MNPEETREKILAATDQLFGDRGFDATTTRDIAERSGVNKALIHYHFGSKEALLSALLDGYYQQMTGTLAAALGRRKGLEAQAEDLIEAYFDFLAGHRSFCSIVHREVASGRHVEETIERTLPMFRIGTAWLQQLVPDPPEGLGLMHVLTSLYGMIVTYFTYGRVLQQLTGQDPFSPEALAERKRHLHRVAAILLREVKRPPLGKGRSSKRRRPLAKKASS